MSLLFKKLQTTCTPDCPQRFESKNQHRLCNLKRLNYLLKRFFLRFFIPFSKPKDENFTFQTSNSFYFSGRFYLFIKKERNAGGESICKRQLGKIYKTFYYCVFNSGTRGTHNIYDGHMLVKRCCNIWRCPAS